MNTEISVAGLLTVSIILVAITVSFLYSVASISRQASRGVVLYLQEALTGSSEEAIRSISMTKDIIPVVAIYSVLKENESSINTITSEDDFIKINDIYIDSDGNKIENTTDPEIYDEVLTVKSRIQALSKYFSRKTRCRIEKVINNGGWLGTYDVFIGSDYY